MMNFLRRMMYGRYGGDQLNNALLVLAMVLMLLRALTGWAFLGMMALALLILCYFRMFSRNIQARYSENQWFMQRWMPVKQAIKGVKTRFSDRKTHCYYKCPQCKKRLRVPRGRGKIEITCPECHTRFVKKT
ncbi:hypothetical protein [Agathobaculum sp.]|uniref:hypothetical protein n=1 Tax=Agathobaculum sp. TaxID=2048138 RepID=UPI002A8246DB|nr:hypothetical protein [Agathobaculum sp.]MDY3617715.1 hypothetical protein [Agathobaculum sp.]